MILTSSKALGEAIRAARTKQNMTQSQLALMCNVGVRFIVDLEKGKETCVLDKSLRVARMLGLKLDITNL